MLKLINLTFVLYNFAVQSRCIKFDKFDTMIDQHCGFHQVPNLPSQVPTDQLFYLLFSSKLTIHVPSEHTRRGK